MKAIFVLLFIFSFYASTGQTIVPLGAPGSATDNYFPIGSFFGYQRCQMAYSSAELTAAGVPANIAITNVAFYISSLNPNPGLGVPIVIYMKEKAGSTILTSQTYAAANSNYTLVYSGVIPESSYVLGTWLDLTLSTPFIFFGGGTNLEVIVESNDGGDGADYPGGYYRYQSRSSTGANNFQYWLQDNNPPTGNGTLQTTRPDIRITYQILLPCNSGDPTGHTLTVNSSIATACSGVPFSLTVGGLFPAYLSNYNYVWESGPTSGGPWTPVGTNSYTTAVTQSLPAAGAGTWYHIKVNCTSSPGTVVTSSAIFIPIQYCYCTASATSAADTDIGQVKLSGQTITLTNPAAPGTTTNNPLAVNTYSTFVGAPGVNVPDLMQGSSYPIQLTQITRLSTFYSAFFNVWIDWNQDGVFDPNAEHVFWGGPTGPTSTAPTITNVSGNVTVPFTALLGTTKMRVMLREQGDANNPPCGNFTWGEVEDYNVSIIAGPPCNLSVAGTATANTLNVCTGTPITLNVTGYSTLGSGITMQWYSSTTSSTGPWTSLGASANYAPYTIASQSATTWYQCVITCPTGTSPLPSNAVQVTQNGATQCYCTPLHGATCSGLSISRVEITPGTLLNNSGCDNLTAQAYSLFPNSGSTTTTINQGTTYSLNVTTQSSTGSISAWIDVNRDGQFSASEWMPIAPVSNPAGNMASIAFNLPNGGPVGLTGLRIRTRLTGNPNGAGDACLEFFSGETEDYYITIASPIALPCAGAPGAFTIASSGGLNLCSGQQITLTASGGSVGALNLNYDWKSGGVSIPGAPNSPIFTTSFSTSQTITCTVTCANPGGSSTTSTNSLNLVIGPALWLGYNNNWTDGQNWCGRIPTVADNVSISFAAANVKTGRPLSVYKSPTVGYNDSCYVKNLTIDATDSLTVLTDSLVKMSVAGNIINNGKLAVLSSIGAADTVTIGSNTAPTRLQIADIYNIFNGSYQDRIYQIIYTADELKAVGMQTGTIIDSLMFYFWNRSNVTASANAFAGLTISYLETASSVLGFSTPDPITGSFTTIYNQTTKTDAPSPSGTWIPNVPNIVITGNSTAASNVISGIASTAGILTGYSIAGPGINIGTTITGVGANSISISQAATATNTGATFTIYAPGWLKLVTSPFIWHSDTSNMVLQFCFNHINSPGSIANTIERMFGTSTAPDKRILFISSNNSTFAAVDGCTMNTSVVNMVNTFGTSPGIYRPNITFRFRQGTQKLSCQVDGNINNNTGAKLYKAYSTFRIKGSILNDGEVYINDRDSTLLEGNYTNNAAGSKLVFGGAAPITTTGNNTTNGNPVITVANLTGAIVGNYVSGPGIQTGSTIIKTTMFPPTITLSKNPTATASNVTFTISNGPVVGFKGSTWTNNGTMTAGYSLVAFDSTVSPQTITGTSASNFYDLSVSKTSLDKYVDMTNNITVGDTLNMKMGQLRMNKKSISVTNSDINAIKYVANSGYIISDDTLSKVIWKVNSVTGLRTIPFGYPASATPSLIPVTYNQTSAVDAGDISFATYKVANTQSNTPYPPTVNHLNSAGGSSATNKTILANGINNGSFIVQLNAAPTGLYVGAPVLAAPAGTGLVGMTVTVIGPGNQVTLSGSATGSAASGTVQFGTYIVAGANDSAHVVDRFWVLSKTGTTPGVTADITFGYIQTEATNVTFNSSTNRPRPQAWYNFAPGMGHWIKFPDANPGTTLSTFTAGNFVARENGFDWSYGNYNPWAIAGLNSPLPVELISFNAILKGEDVSLDWVTATEKNNDFFTVERTLDFKEISEISKVKGKGNSVDLRSYNTWDTNPVQNAINYYRLRQTDFDGNTEIVSEYVPVRIGVKSNFSIDYIRNENTVDIIFNYDSNLPLAYELYDLSGRIITTGNGINVEEGTNILHMDASSLAHGFYIIKLYNQEKSVTQKFMY